MAFLSKCWNRLLSQDFLPSASGAGLRGSLGNPWPFSPLPPLGLACGAFLDLRGEFYFRIPGILLPSPFPLQSFSCLPPTQVSAHPFTLSQCCTTHVIYGGHLHCLLSGIWSVLVPTPLMLSLPLIPVDTFQAIFPRPYMKAGMDSTLYTIVFPILCPATGARQTHS